MFKKVAAILALATLLAYSAVKFPYPQRKNYGNETVNVTSASASGNLKTSFESYMSKFYVEQGSQARIKFYDPDKPGDDQYTVSEGIGYAMLMAVYFSDATKSYEDQFKKLWAYYKANTNNNGVMNWKINGFSGAAGQNGATDAEFDVALALAMARYQFDNTQYENDAKDLIGKIWASEMESNGLHKPGDAWNGNKNPSYVAPAAFEIFKGLGDATNWGKAITANYDLLKKNQNSSTGLPSGWSDASGNPNTCTNNCGQTTAAYDQDAVRAPWRWATAYAWFGHADAKTLLNKLASWVNGKTASDVKGPISLSGSMGSNANSSYTGSLMNALMVSSTYQDKLNSYWNVVNGFNEASYFNHSMQLLTGLLATGNMPNLKACAAGNCGTNMSTGGGGNDKDYTSLSKFDWFDYSGGTEEENMGFGANLESWFVYTDEESHGTSTVTNDKFSYKNESNDCKEETGYRSVKKADGEWAATIPSYTFGQGKNRYAPFVGIALNAKDNGKTYHLEGCTGGFSYKYKGQGHNFKVRTTPIPETSGADYFIAVKTATTAWTEQIVAIADLAQPSWASSAQKVPFKAEEIYGFIWELKGPDAKNCASGDLDASKGDNYCANPTPGTVDGGISKNTGSLAIKDFHCLGKIELPTSRANACSEGATIEGPGNGSGSTPVISLQYKASNAFAVRNGVNLQVSKNAIMEVFGLNGKSVRKQEFSSGNHSIMLNDLPRGLYLVKVQFGSQTEVLRVPVR